MNALETNFEPIIRFAIFLLVLLVILIFEIVNPRRRLYYSKKRRWLTNFALSVSNSIILSVLLPFVGIGAAMIIQNNGWGLFNLLDLADWFSIPLYLLLFDLIIYFQHRIFHKVDFLWKLHRMHHTDLDYDVSTGIRFHPLSILISSLIKLILILALGPPVIAVLISEILLNATSMFNHSNWHIPKRFDAVLRLILVTPDVHRVHHSTNPDEHGNNFGFNFPWWDRLFGTYKAQPTMGHDSMQIGIEGFNDQRSIEFFPALAQPFNDKPTSNSALN
ncbi:MAG: sterol desaturase family protein [Gammaproteobacteria bacterium]|nr:sterol desaturase family protein [Gammaproteobacteria bacterium]